MHYSVVVADLDGTLLSQEHTLSLFTQETLRLLSKYNIHFVFATGRHHIDVKYIKKNLVSAVL